MKIIRPNDIEFGEIEAEKLDALKIDAKTAVKELVNIDTQYIQSAKAERDTVNLLRCGMHPFVEAAHLAYSDHLPLVITPDSIWYLISSGVAKHINQHAEELRHKFVSHEGKKEILIRRDDFVLGSQTNPWHEVVDDFSGKIRENTNNDVADLMVADFSTTSKDARVVSQIVLMDAMQKYFDFKFQTMCGIPEIRIAGDKQDWENVRNKTSKLVGLIPELKKWLDNGLSDILNHFVDAFDDKVDKDFWNQLYKMQGGSGGPFVTGWILSLFPYLADDSQNGYAWLEGGWRESVGGDFFSGVTTSQFDYHMNQVPFTWEYLGKEVKMLFIGGLVGIAYETDKSVAPVFGYAVTENKVNNSG